MFCQAVEECFRLFQTKMSITGFDFHFDSVGAGPVLLFMFDARCTLLILLVVLPRQDSILCQDHLADLASQSWLQQIRLEMTPSKFGSFVIGDAAISLYPHLSTNFSSQVVHQFGGYTLSE